MAQPFAASLDREPIPVTTIPPPPISFSRGARRSSGKNIRASPRVHHSHNIGPPSYFLLVVGYEWVRDDVLKYQSSITSVASVATPEH